MYITKWVAFSSAWKNKEINKMKFMPALCVSVVLTCQGYKHVFGSSTAATCEWEKRCAGIECESRHDEGKKKIAGDNDCFKTQVRERVAPPWHTDTVLIHKHAAFAYVHMSSRTVTIGRVTSPPTNQQQNVVTWVVHKEEQGEEMEGWGKGWRRRTERQWFHL